MLSDHDAQKETGALVIGGDYRGLGVVRSLGRRGIPVWVLTTQHKIAAYSRYSCRHIPWPDSGSEEEQIEFLLRLLEVNRLTQWVIFPTLDETAALLARNQKRLAQHYRLPATSSEILCLFYDKRQTYRFAEQIGVAAPWTRYPRDREEVSRLKCDYPVILKPAYREGFNPFFHAKAWKVNNRAELLNRYDKACQYVDPEFVMVQEWIPGGGETQYSFAALCKDGRPLAYLTARRTRQFPMDFGRLSTFVETVELHQVEEAARRLLGSTGYTGIVEVEFKLDLRTGAYKLLDVNPRVWGWHTLSRRAGVDFPFLLWKMIQGEKISEVRGRPGVRWIRMVTDFPVVVKEIANRRLSLGAYLKSLRPPLETAIFARDDPLPALVEIPLLVALSVKRGSI